MNRRKALSLSLAAVAVLTLALGSGAFTSVSAERGVSVAVVGDDEAYVGYNSSDVVATDGEKPVDLVTVANRFPAEIQIEEATVESDGIVEEDDLVFDDLSPISPGNTTSIAWDSSDCSVLKTGTVAMTVEVAGTGVWAEIDGETETREFVVTCAPSEAVRFNGGGTVNVDTNDGEELEVEYWTTNASANSNDIDVDGPFESNPINASENENLNTNDKVVAIYLPEYEVTYVHQGYDVSTGDSSNWGRGYGQPYSGIPDGLPE